MNTKLVSFSHLIWCSSNSGIGFKAFLLVTKGCAVVTDAHEASLPSTHCINQPIITASAGGVAFW